VDQKNEDILIGLLAANLKGSESVSPSVGIF